MTIEELIYRTEYHIDRMYREDPQNKNLPLHSFTTLLELMYIMQGELNGIKLGEYKKLKESNADKIRELIKKIMNAHELGQPDLIDCWKFPAQRRIDLEKELDELLKDL